MLALAFYKHFYWLTTDDVDSDDTFYSTFATSSLESIVDITLFIGMI